MTTSGAIRQYARQYYKAAEPPCTLRRKERLTRLAQPASACLSAGGSPEPALPRLLPKEKFCCDMATD